MFRKYKDVILEAVTWFSVFSFAILVSFLFPWDIAEDLLRNIAIVAGLAAVFWYLRSRRLWQESQKKSEELTRRHREVESHHKTIDLIFNNATDGILILDKHQQILSFSPSMESITGFLAGEAVGKNISDILKFTGDKENEPLPKAIFEPEGRKRKPHLNNALQTKDGRVIDVEVSYKLIRELNDTKALAIIRDVTYENELIQRDKEFIAVTSHQLNTPLSIIRGYLSLLKHRSGDLTKRQQTYLEEITEAVKKMIALTNNMLSIARIESEKVKLKIERINVTDLLEQLYQDFAPTAAKKNIALIFPKLTTNLYIEADGEKVGQVISNLLDNSLKYTHHGSISVKVEKREHGALFTVNDTGIGIPPEEVEKIGQKFYRAQNAIDIDNKGTGLGMFIAKMIVEKHGGIFKITSEVGKGSTFQFTIPS